MICIETMAVKPPLGLAATCATVPQACSASLLWKTSCSTAGWALACIVNESDLRIKRLSGKIDRVLVDAPCSGLGTLRRNPDLKWRQTPASVAELCVKQRDILRAAAHMLKVGGRLVYATCSILDEENSAIVNAFLLEHPNFVRLSSRKILKAQGIEIDCGDDLRLLPHVHGTDGFYAAVLQRQS